MTTTVREFMFYKVRVCKGYFCKWLRKNWPTLTSCPYRTNTKYWIAPFLFSLLEFQKQFPPINMSCLKSWFLVPGYLYKGGEEAIANRSYSLQMMRTLITGVKYRQSKYKITIVSKTLRPKDVVQTHVSNI